MYWKEKENRPIYGSIQFLNHQISALMSALKTLFCLYYSLCNPMSVCKRRDMTFKNTLTIITKWKFGVAMQNYPHIKCSNLQDSYRPTSKHCLTYAICTALPLSVHGRDVSCTRVSSHAVYYLKGSGFSHSWLFVHVMFSPRAKEK